MEGEEGRGGVADKERSITMQEHHHRHKLLSTTLHTSWASHSAIARHMQETSSGKSTTPVQSSICLHCESIRSTVTSGGREEDARVHCVRRLGVGTSISLKVRCVLWYVCISAHLRMRHEA